MPPATIDALHHLDVLVLDCLRLRKHPTHLNLEEALALIERLRPRRAYLTHIAHDIKHERDSHLLPHGVGWAYDGLEVTE
jgi:phosphoribosyl 1,2-cyclic phosphate phosphodiesterase